MQFMRKNRYLPLIGILLALLLIPGAYKLHAQSQYGNFPFQASFLNKKVPPGIKFPGSRNSATPLDEGMQLTDALENQFGAIYLNDHYFKSELGIYIEFEYMAYDGTGGDGLSVFFFNADEPSPNIGAPGAGLGYAYNRTIDTYSSQRVEGLRGGFMGIGFDSFGNYSGLRWQGESRVQGISYTYYNASNGPGVGSRGTSNAVTIRGARRSTGFSPYGMGVGYAGYPVLVTQRTEVNDGVILSENSTTPQYIINDQLRNERTFTIRGGEAFERPTDPGYRKAYIEMFPNGDQGFYLSVMIEHDNVKDTVIYDYNYKKEFYYYENAFYDTTGDRYTGPDVPKNPQRVLLQTQLPVELKIGFAAATGLGSGKRTDRHVIKNVGIRLPESAEANDDFLEDRYIGTSSIVFKPLLNDIGYTGQVQRHKSGSPEHLDPASFKFVDANGNVPNNPHELVVTGEGRWVYTSDGNDYNTGTVTFYPEPNFGDKARVRYIIKAKDDTPHPHGDDAYYSVPATIGVDLIENPNPPRNLITNKMITPMLK